MLDAVTLFLKVTVKQVIRFGYFEISPFFNAILTNINTLTRGVAMGVPGHDLLVMRPPKRPLFDIMNLMMTHGRFVQHKQYINKLIILVLKHNTTNNTIM